MTVIKLSCFEHTRKGSLRLYTIMRIMLSMFAKCQEKKDCSFDDTNYTKTHTFTRDNGTVTFYTNENYMDESHVGKTLIDYNGYSWALVTPHGFWGDSSVEFLNVIF